MNGQPIPGFYYDPEKKKYFKIQSANASRDLDLKYSAENIRKRQRIDSVKSAAAARISKTRKERVVRRHTSNVTNTCIEREIGFKRRSHYIQSLWPDACMYGVISTPQMALEKPSMYPAIRYFDRDPYTNNLYAIHGDNIIKSHNPLPRRRIPSPHRSDIDYEWTPIDSDAEWAESSEWGRTTSPVSSINFMTVSSALAVTSYGSDRPPVVHFSDTRQDDFHISEQFTPKNCSTIWGAASCPPCFHYPPSIPATKSEQLAVGTSNSLLMFTRYHVWDFEVALERLDSPIYSLDWLSHTTVAMGCRNGKVLLYDTRSGGSSHILTHPQPVTKIKRTDDPTRVICAGLNNSLHLYDIRSSRPSSFHRNIRSSTANTHYNDTYFSSLNSGGPMRGKKRQKLDYINAAKWSQPLLTFQHSNLDGQQADIAVHTRLGLVAAAQDDQTDVAIRVSNIWTGKVVKEFKREISEERISGTKKESSPIRTLKWVNDHDNSNTDLWSTWEGGVARFTW